MSVELRVGEVEAGGVVGDAGQVLDRCFEGGDDCVW